MGKYLVITTIIFHCLSAFWIAKRSGNWKRKNDDRPKNRLLIFKDFVFAPIALSFVVSYLLFDDSALWKMTNVATPGIMLALGAAVTACGAGLKIWAYYVLGSNWSSRIDFFPHQRLITNGPYRYVRHPVYLSYLLTFVGCSLACGQMTLLLLGCVYFYLNILRAKEEEDLLRLHIGRQHDEYSMRVGKAVPIVFRDFAIHCSVMFILCGTLIGISDEISWIVTGRSFTLNFFANLCGFGV